MHAIPPNRFTGLEPFRRLLNDARFADLPILIETEKTSRSARPHAIETDPLDVKNLETLRALRASPQLGIPDQR